MTENNLPLGSPELLTVEEFAQRFRVGRSTVFFWIATKKMIQGLHYYKIGKTVRIPWSMDLLAALSTPEEGDSDTKPDRSRKYQNSINLAY